MVQAILIGLLILGWLMVSAMLKVIGQQSDNDERMDWETITRGEYEDGQ